jgi:hypothetical protein
MLATLSGIVKLVRLVHDQNTFCSMLATVLGIVTLVTFVKSPNAKYPMRVTGKPLIVAGITTSPPAPLYRVMVIVLLLVMKVNWACAVLAANRTRTPKIPMRSPPRITRIDFLIITHVIWFGFTKTFPHALLLSALPMPSQIFAQTARFHDQNPQHRVIPTQLA